MLSGLVLSLWCGGLAAILTYLNQKYLASLFIWGAGSLAQQSWVIPVSLIWKLAVVSIICAVSSGRSPCLIWGEQFLGARGEVIRLRAIVIVCAVALAAFVTSAVGVIGFIGMVAPTITRLAGARRPAQLILWSPLVGAGLLFFADSVLQLVAGELGDFLPTGAVTAIFGSPLLLALFAATEDPAPNSTGRDTKTVAPMGYKNPDHHRFFNPRSFCCCSACLSGEVSMEAGRLFSVNILSIFCPSEYRRYSLSWHPGRCSRRGRDPQRLTRKRDGKPRSSRDQRRSTFGVAIALFRSRRGFPANSCLR